MDKETIYRQDVLDLAKKGILVSNGNYESVCKAINEIPPVNPQPCDDAISREHTLAEFKRWYFDDKTVIRCAELVLKNEPPVNPTKTGHWIWCVGSHKCSNCEEYTCFSHKELLRYCPNCGAKMIEPQERNDKK